MQFFLHTGTSFDFLIECLDATAIELFVLVNLLVVVFHHLLVRFGVDWGLSKWLLSSCLLNFDDHFSLLVFSCVFFDFFCFIHLLARPPQNSPMVVKLNI